jgi:ABC-type sulfate/molybdate transport systems ATPase subunit
MDDSQNNAEAFRRFLNIVTGPLLLDEPVADPDEKRISALEREIRRLQRNLRRSAPRRSSVLREKPLGH